MELFLEIFCGTFTWSLILSVEERLMSSSGNFLFLSLLHLSHRGALYVANLRPSVCTWAAPCGFSPWYWELNGWEDEGQAHASFIFKNIWFLEPIVTDALSMLNNSTLCGRTGYEENCIGSNKHLPLQFMSKKSVAVLSWLYSRAVVLHRFPCWNLAPPLCHYPLLLQMQPLAQFK